MSTALMHIRVYIKILYSVSPTTQDTTRVIPPLKGYISELDSESMVTREESESTSHVTSKAS